MNSQIQLSEQKASQTLKLQREAEQQVFSSSATWLVAGGVTFLLFNPVSLPLAVIAASPFVWSAINRAWKNGVNAEYLHESGNFAHILNGKQLMRLTRILGKDEVIAQLLEAHQEHKPISGDALDYLEAAGHDVETPDLEQFLAIERETALPTREDAAIVSVIAQTIPPRQSETEGTPTRPCNRWISDLLFEADGSLRQQHIALNGKTRSGKSTLGSHLMSCIAGNQQPKIWLVNPKHIASSPDWIGITPFCKSIGGYVEALTHFNELLKQRVDDRNFNYATAEPWFILLEELDWAVSEHGKREVLALIRPLIKVGSALKIVVILIGQSAQADFFTGSDWRQFSRLVIGNEALAFLSNPQFAYSSEVKDPLRAEAETLTRQETRFALVIPFAGLPTIQCVPNLTIAPAIAIESDLSDEDETIVEAVRVRQRLESLFEDPKPVTLGNLKHQAIVAYCQKKGGSATVRELQQAKHCDLVGLNSEGIRSLMLELQNLGKGRLKDDCFTLG